MLLKNIKALVGVHPASQEKLQGAELKNLPMVEDAWLHIENGLIKDFGSMNEMPDAVLTSSENTIDATGKYVFPSWCDSHTHLVFAASREEEFMLKIKGASYEEIAAAGGGILNSAKKMQAASEDELYKSASKRLNEVILQGTGAIEIKSGYGLTIESELKMLRVIKRLKQNFPIPIKATFLGAHTFPTNFKEDRAGYIKLLTEEMLPKIAEEGLADYIDVFCEKGFFSLEETAYLIEKGKQFGLTAKIHTNQLSISGGVELAVKHQAISVDHLEELDEQAILALRNGATIATLLPSCSFYLGIPFAKARDLVNANAVVALASDYNPGSTPSGNMNFVISLGCIKLKLLPEEAINAATLNGAAAMQLNNEVGSIAKGKRANLFITKEMPSIAYLPYSFGQTQIETVILNGKIYNEQP